LPTIANPVFKGQIRNNLDSYQDFGEDRGRKCSIVGRNRANMHSDSAE